MFLYEFAEKTAQKPDTVATYVRRNKKIFKNHVERRQKQIWLDEKAVDILLKKYPEVQKKQKKPLNKERFDEIITKSLKTLYENQEILAKEIDEIRALVEELEESFDHKEPVYYILRSGLTRKLIRFLRQSYNCLPSTAPGSSEIIFLFNDDKSPGSIKLSWAF